MLTDLEKFRQLFFEAETTIFTYSITEWRGRKNKLQFDKFNLFNKTP